MGLFVCFLELRYFSLGKMRCEGEEVVPSLQKLLSMLAVAKSVQITLWSWDTAMRKQGATEEAKRLSWGPEENAQSLLLFLVFEWNKTKSGNERHASSQWIGEIGVRSPVIPFGISVWSYVFITIKS